MKKDTNSCLVYIEGLCSDVCKQSELLFETIRSNNIRIIFENKKLSDSLLEESDKKKLFLIRNVSKAFVTPLDREDLLMSALLIYRLSFMFNNIFTQLCSQGLTNFGDVFENTTEILLKSCEKNKFIIGRFGLPFSDEITEKHINETASLRQKSSKLHSECVKKLFSDIQSPYALVVRQSIYEKIKECCDLSYDISDFAICVIIKNT